MSSLSASLPRVRAAGFVLVSHAPAMTDQVDWPHWEGRTRKLLRVFAPLSLPFRSFAGSGQDKWILHTLAGTISLISAFNTSQSSPSMSSAWAAARKG